MTDLRMPEKKPELLAPAGTLLALIAGVENGADAIYLGASRFNARAYAGNFSDDEIQIGMDFAHAFGKKIFVTLNTLFRDDELDDVMKLFFELYERGVDAVILQDLGFLNLLQKCPDIPIELHASTQMTVHNSYHASFLKGKGISRIVPARENTLSELSSIKESGIEIETFIHGALCICYSGQCLFSGTVGGRSGNRGQCAQPCRKKYTLAADGRNMATDGKYLISPRDLNASEELHQLIDIGVDSFKIEGRMKKSEYVAGVVSVYRKIIDRYISLDRNFDSKRKEKGQAVRQSAGPTAGKTAGPTKEEKEILKKLFNRDFTSGYFVKNPKNELMSRRLPYNKGILIGKVTAIDPDREQISVLLSASLSSQDGISVGDVGRETDFSKDPRQGFLVKKMYVSRKIVNLANDGETANIIAPVLFSGDEEDFPKIGDFVYKTSDFNLQKEIQKTLPEMQEEDIRAGIKNANLNSKSEPEKTKAIMEWIEKLAPPIPIQIPIHISCEIRVGVPIKIAAKDEDGNEIQIESEYIVQPAQKNPFSKEQAEDILSKPASPIYSVLSAAVDLTGDCFVPVGVLKETRNKALMELLSARVGRSRPDQQSVLETQAVFFQKIEYENQTQNANQNANQTQNANQNANQINLELSGRSLEKPLLLTVSAYTKEDVKGALAAGADRIYVGGDIFSDPLTGENYGLSPDDIRELILEIDPQDVEKIWLKTSFVTKEEDFDVLYKTLFEFSGLGISGILASNPGVYYFVQTKLNEKFNIGTDGAFNIFNARAAEMMSDEGASFITLSSELSIKDIAALSENLKMRGKYADANLECIVHGRGRLMVTEHPLLETLLKDKEKENEKVRHKNDRCLEDQKIFRYTLADSKDFVFPVLADTHGRTFIFNSKELNAYDLLPKLKKSGITAFRIDGVGHTPDEIKELVTRYKKEIERIESQVEILETGNDSEESKDGAEFTRGNFIRGVY
ncbi:DUF3656 domain-containing U32 family peptidase [Methanolapillus ohkumae]|uniref:Peptidase U32 collagenase domain-containing protein n=1 Tax=Methanolapillus ohkumae TaxID=3028298 RepID=A0AA97A6L4_9EURY|nr:hypothetical protein MsAm2_12250 [Methanosarcinaceae archaeon Am2]